VTLVKTAKRITEQPLHKMPRETLFSYIWQTHRIRNISHPEKNSILEEKLQLLNELYMLMFFAHNKRYLC